MSHNRGKSGGSDESETTVDMQKQLAEMKNNRLQQRKMLKYSPKIRQLSRNKVFVFRLNIETI